MDTRFPGGIMPAWSKGPEDDRTLMLEFEPMGFVGFGTDVEGRLTRSDYEITREGADREIARQYWMPADGTGRRWLAVQYEYTRVR